MVKRTAVLVGAAIVLCTTWLPALGGGYPPRSHFTDDGVIYGCLRESDETNRYELDFKRDGSYRDLISKNGGRYDYIRSRGRINFNSGPVNRFFLKVVTHGGSIYEYRLKRESDRTTWGNCFPTYPS